jgi:hypothetical protein
MASPSSGRAECARPDLIRYTPLQGDDEGIDLRKLIPAWVISGVIHVVTLSVLLLVTVGASGGSVNGDYVLLQSDVDNPVKDANFYEDSIGDDPETPLAYPLDRIEPISVPGPINPNELPGLATGQHDVPPMNIPAPPGFSHEGGGAFVSVPSKDGKGTMIEGPLEGYLRGVRNMPGGLDGRSGSTKDKLLGAFGGNSRSEAAVATGLKWIIRHQALDGHWGMNDFHVAGKCNCTGAAGNHVVAGTGFGLLPLLGAGETHKGTGKANKYAKNVERALKWLITRQGADGSFSTNGYEHAIATIAICEAYGITADPVLKGPAQRAINCCVAWQNAAGGFRYSPREAGDLSVTGWFVQALKSGHMAGLSVPNATWAGVNNFLDSVSNPQGSGYMYLPSQKEPAVTMTPVGLLSRQYMGWNPRNMGLVKGAEYLRKLPPSANFNNIYYYYYATQVMYHMAPINPEGWNQWNGRMRDLLIDTQDAGLTPERPDQKGSWLLDGDCLGKQLGRLGYTSLCLLTLEVYYRHLPLYRRELSAMKDEAIQRD